MVLLPTMDHQTEKNSALSRTAWPPTQLLGVPKWALQLFRTTKTLGTRHMLTESGSDDKEVKDDFTTTKRGTWKKDELFFFSFVTFRVEDELFRVPKDAFENHSEHFRKLFTTASTGSERSSTGDIDEPIFLEGIKKESFQDLLRLMYPPPRASIFTGPILMDRQQWINILDHAQEFKLAGIRDLAVRQLQITKFEEVERLEVALKYRIEHWYADAYFALAKRPEPLSDGEGQRLGLDLCLKMARVRERRMARLIKKPSDSKNAANVHGNKANDPEANPGTPCNPPSGDAEASNRETTKGNTDGPTDTPGTGESGIASESEPTAQASRELSVDGTAEASDDTKGASFALGSTPALEIGTYAAAFLKRKSNTVETAHCFDDALLRQDIKETFGL